MFTPGDRVRHVPDDFHGAGTVIVARTRAGYIGVCWDHDPERSVLYYEVWELRREETLADR